MASSLVLPFDALRVALRQAPFKANAAFTQHVCLLAKYSPLWNTILTDGTPPAKVTRYLKLAPSIKLSVALAALEARERPLALAPRASKKMKR